MLHFYGMFKFLSLIAILSKYNEIKNSFKYASALGGVGDCGRIRTIIVV